MSGPRSRRAGPGGAGRRSGRRRIGYAALALPLTVALGLAGCGHRSGGAAPGSDSGTDESPRGQVTVLAAASLTETFTELGQRFERKHPGVQVRSSFGASSTLARQVVEGAPADVFAAADPTTMRTVTEADLGSGPPDVFVRNKLRIAVPRGNPAEVSGLADFARGDLTLSVCARQVPCGRAAARAFAAAKVGPRPDTYGQDVKAVLTKVRQGEVDAGLVYASDVRSARGDVDGIDLPEAFAATNDYPIVALREAPNPDAARAFVAYVRSEVARGVLTDAGFEVP